MMQNQRMSEWKNGRASPDLVDTKISEAADLAGKHSQRLRD